MQFDIGMLFVVIGTSTCSPNTCYQIEYGGIWGNALKWWMFPEYLALQPRITAVIVLTVTRIREQFHTYHLNVFIFLCYLTKITFDMNNPAFRTGWWSNSDTSSTKLIYMPWLWGGSLPVRITHVCCNYQHLSASACSSIWNLIIRQKLNCSVYCIRSTGVYSAVPAIRTQLNVHYYETQTIHRRPGT
jgi:hypothetical protein